LFFQASCDGTCCKKGGALCSGGVAKALDKWKDFGSDEWIWSYGTGFRYYLAKFGLRMGIDVASPVPGVLYCF
jgi:hypothetical protein